MHLSKKFIKICRELSYPADRQTNTQRQMHNLSICILYRRFCLLAETNVAETENAVTCTKFNTKEQRVEFFKFVI